MPRAKVGKRYFIIKDFKKYPKDDYVENFLKLDDNTAFANVNGDPISFVIRDRVPRLVNQLPKAIKRGNDLMFPIPENDQIIELRHEAILGVFQYRKKVYAITFPIYDEEEPE